MKKKNPEMLTTFVRNNGQDKKSLPSDFSAMLHILFVLCVLVLMSVYYYGLRALIIALASVAVCWIIDVLCLVVRRKTVHIHDLSAVITGLTIAVMMPASVPYTVVCAAGAFAVLLAKHTFGGHGNEIFNCAAVGYIFAELSYPSAVLSYPKPFIELPLSNIVNQPLINSFTKSVMFASDSSYSDYELMIGNFPGPMGCTFTILIIVCAVVLISRKAASPAVFVTETVVVLLWRLITDGMFGVKTALAGGMLIFGILFFSADYSIIPQNTGERFFFGLISGIMIIIISEISSLENPVVYAAVVTAPFAMLTGKFGEFIHRRRRVKQIFGSTDADIKEMIDMIGDRTDAGE